MPKRLLAAAILAAALLIAGCGSGDQTSAAATCLRNALANENLHGGTNCADSTSYSAMKATGAAITVDCTHQNANQYVCDVTGPGTQTGVSGGFYSVTYDGSSIVFQPS